MQTEIEAKFLNIDADKLREKLKTIGAACVYPERSMRRKTFDHPTLKKNDWFRVRDEGDVITMSYKRVEDRSLHGTKEITVSVSDFNAACALLENAHLTYKSYQETKREKWKLGEVEITLDTWPWIPQFVEIEAPDEKSIKEVSSKLGFDWKDALHGSVENAYQAVYNVTEEEIDHWQEIRFIPVPEWLEKKRK